MKFELVYRTEYLERAKNRYFYNKFERNRPIKINIILKFRPIFHKFFFFFGSFSTVITKSCVNYFKLVSITRKKIDEYTSRFLSN